MKKYIIPLSIVAATFAASCSSDENLPQEIDNSTYGSFCRIECAPIPYKHRHSERFKVLSCKIELFNSSIGHFAG